MGMGANIGESIFLLVMTLLGVLLMLGAVSLVLIVVGRWKIFKKAGLEGWKALIPFYADYCLYRIGWETKFYWAALILSVAISIVSSIDGEKPAACFAIMEAVLSIAAFVFFVILQIRLSEKFGHGGGFAVGLVLLHPIFTLVLGLDSSFYRGNPAENMRPAPWGRQGGVQMPADDADYDYSENNFAIL